MGTSVYFNGKVRKLPGAYSTITSGEQNTPQNLDYGSILLIDNGTGATWGGGSGSNGALLQGKDSIYKFTDIDTFKSFVKGGIFWKMAEALFFPFPGVSGVSTVYFAKAATTVPASMTFTVATTGAVKKKDTVTLSGTDGTANISCGGVTKLATFASTLKTTADNFVTAWASAYLAAGVVVTAGVTNTLIFEASVAGVDFVSAATVNVTLTLAGTTVNTTANATGVGGTFKIKAKSEGIVGNGILTSAHLDKGYAFTISTGVNDVAKFIFNIWQGSWKGDHTDAIAFDEITKATAPATLLVQSPEFNSLSTLINWATTDSAFGNRFVLDATSVAIGAGTVVSGDVSAYATYSVATGGTETYAAGDLSTVLTAITELDYQFLLSDLTVPANYNTAPTTTLLSHVSDTSTSYIKTLVIGGGADQSKFTTESIAMAVGLNTNRAIVVHGSVKKRSNTLAAGFRVWPPIYHAANVLGRIAGLPPQVPVTNKQISVDGLVHNLTKKEQETALDSGLTVTIIDQFRGGFKVLQGVNTLADNKSLFNALGQSFSIQFERITAQINRELVINSEIELLSNENGVNANTLSAGLLKTWTETYLGSKVANASVDNLLLSFRNVTVTRVEDYYKVTYGIVVNNEITKIFYTGFLFKS